jgi:site-specific recombinase XerD
VFTNEVGIPIFAQNVRYYLQKFLKATGLPIIRINDLRHTYATILIQNGIPIKVVSEYLGHSNIKMTLDIYGHVTQKMRDDFAYKVRQIFTAHSEIENNLHTYSHREEEGHLITSGKHEE